MTTLTDLQICKRIAEIEGLIISSFSPCSDWLMVHTLQTVDSSVTAYDPLTDGSLCLNLMDMYSVNIKYRGGNIFARCSDSNADWVKGNDLKMVSCLAIIEAHKE